FRTFAGLAAGRHGQPTRLPSLRTRIPLSCPGSLLPRPNDTALPTETRVAPGTNHRFSTNLSLASRPADTVSQRDSRRFGHESPSPVQAPCTRGRTTRLCQPRLASLRARIPDSRLTFRWPRGRPSTSAHAATDAPDRPPPSSD